MKNNFIFFKHKSHLVMLAFPHTVYCLSNRHYLISEKPLTYLVFCKIHKSMDYTSVICDGIRFLASNVAYLTTMYVIVVALS